MSQKTVVYAPKPDHSAEWRFTASKATRSQYPDAPGDQIGMDLQEDEVMMLSPVSSASAGRDLVINIKEGRVELLNFTKDWREVKAAGDDSILWDVSRILEAWSSDD